MNGLVKISEQVFYMTQQSQPCSSDYVCYFVIRFGCVSALWINHHSGNSDKRGRNAVWIDRSRCNRDNPKSFICL